VAEFSVKKPAQFWVKINRLWINAPLEGSLLDVDHPDSGVTIVRKSTVILFLSARAMLHGQNRNCRVFAEIIQNPAGHAERNPNVQREINGMGFVQD
jgi:hypothetical protein